ncbi:patatin-like phospholipase family protein [Roseibium aggregatum]|uniref:Patatin-like phospholipase family protein n=1 Tax=Roseibium aggregatum TaxID=187304 RepID=A0A926NYK4_9HYPH|nr:patatin-like phospholipase family protein [Roseibium aggregatum]MBD1546093.1 patatin-like phospholipase family protein [Roseibium aggregatum]
MTQPRIGLALGGGGARGISHIPVLEAFDDLGIRPYAITGSSIGAIMGAAYASGLAGADIRRIALQTFADRNTVLSHLWKLRPKRFVEVFNGNLVTFDPLKVLDVFLGDYLPGTFEDLAIPLNVMATDFYGCSEVVIGSGPLLPAIAASIAIPAVFKPVERQGRILIDGGVINPLPFDRLPAECDIVVAVDVVGAPVRQPGRDVPTSMESIFGTSQILMQSITAGKLQQQRPDILVQPEHDNVRVLDFLKTKDILERTAPLRGHLSAQLQELILHSFTNENTEISQL